MPEKGYKVVNIKEGDEFGKLDKCARCGEKATADGIHKVVKVLAEGGCIHYPTPYTRPMLIDPIERTASSIHLFTFLDLCSLGIIKKSGLTEKGFAILPTTPVDIWFITEAGLAFGRKEWQRR